MKKMSIVLAMAACSLAFSPLAQADGGSCQWDKKGHGGKHAGMKAADANGDGVTSKEEFMQAATKRAERRFAHMDANADGVLDHKDKAAYFDRMDGNHDGQISREEFKAAHSKKRNPCK